ncbi:MAG TPA: hypothetical protein VGR81_07580 [Candidatus Acidoferrales bacterium]|nr:hypothetical protein [Candidatus Acidoferrales bacterium]
MTGTDCNEGGGGIGNPPSAIRTGPREVRNEAAFFGGGGIGNPPSAIRTKPREVRNEAAFFGGGGIGNPPSAIRTGFCDFNSEAALLDGGGIGDPPSAFRIFAGDKTTDRCKLGPNTQMTQADSINRHVFLKFIYPPGLRDLLTLRAGYGDIL